MLILAGMTFLKYLSPIRAIQDLRMFLSQRGRHELWFLFAAIIVTTLLITGFVMDAHVEKTYKREVIYVQDWRLSRSDAEIRAQQVIDQAKREARMAELKKKQAARQAEFKRLDDKLEKWGL
jgi:cytochrome b subunit of formate dehydrogenase